MQRIVFKGRDDWTSQVQDCIRSSFTFLFFKMEFCFRVLESTPVPMCEPSVQKRMM